MLSASTETCPRTIPSCRFKDAHGAGAGEAEGKELVQEIDEARDPSAFVRFCDGLTEFMQELAQLVVRKR
jgi:hypothetical protein